MDHTPEPWEIADERQYIIVISKSPLRYAVVNGLENSANARRIVACVNACEGLTNKELSHGRVTPVHRFSTLAHEKGTLAAKLSKAQAIIMECLPYVSDAIDSDNFKASAKPKIRALYQRMEKILQEGS